MSYDEIKTKAKELAEAIKQDILGKVEPKKLYRNFDGHTVVSYDLCGIDMLQMTTVLKPNSDTVREAIDMAVERIVIDDAKSLRTGCWGMSESPIGTVKELTVEETKALVKKNVQKVAEVFRERMEGYVLECLGMNEEAYE